MFRLYENPRALEKSLRDAKERLRQDTDNVELAMYVDELEQRVNFAWQDEEWEEEES